MVERPKLGLENPTRRARLRGARRTLNEAAISRGTPQKSREIKARAVAGHTHSSLLRPGTIADISYHLPKQAKSQVLKRQMRKPVYNLNHPKHKRPALRTLAGAGAFLLVIFALAGTVWVVKAQKSEHTSSAQQKPSVLGSNNTHENIDESEITGSISSYAVAGDMPRFLVIDKLAVKARVRPVGSKGMNSIIVPDSIYDVGWYTGSKKPGEPGAVVMDGHVSGPTKRGVFYSLGTLKVGDLLEIELGNGRKISYTIKNTEVFDNDKVNMAKILSSSETAKPGLNLITSSGRFNVRTSKYEQRVAVYAIQN